MKQICKISLFVVILISTCVRAQDIIVTNDAQKIEAKILEVSKSEIRYKEADDLEGPTFILETTEISSVIYSNGKVVLYNKETSQISASVRETELQTQVENSKKQTDIKYFYEGLNEQERYALNNYLDGYPKNIVAIKGDYSLIFNRKCRIFLDLNFDEAEYGVYEVDRHMNEYSKLGDFSQYIKNENLEINKNAIIQNACDVFNKKMLNNKCTFLPITALTQISSYSPQDYKMILHVKRIDVGSGAVSVMSSGRTTTGGAIVCGNIEIKQASSNSPVCILIVDRVQGMGNAHESIRIQNVIEEIIANKLYNIKKYKLYTKEF